MSKPRRRLPCNGARCWSLSIIIVGCTLRRDLDTKEVGTLGIRFSPQHVGQTCPLRKESSMISYLEHARKDATIQIYTVIHNCIFIYTVYMHAYVYIHIYITNNLLILMLSKVQCSAIYCYQLAHVQLSVWVFHGFLQSGHPCVPARPAMWTLREVYPAMVNPCESHIFPWYNSIVVFPIEINWVEFKVHLLPFTPIYFRPSFHGYSIHYLSLNHPPRPTSAASARTPHARPSPLRRLLHVISHVGLIRFNLVEPCLTWLMLIL